MIILNYIILLISSKKACMLDKRCLLAYQSERRGGSFTFSKFQHLMSFAALDGLDNVCCNINKVAKVGEYVR